MVLAVGKRYGVSLCCDLRLCYGVSFFYGVGCVMVFARVMVLTRDGWCCGSHGLSARRAGRSKSRGPKGLQQEVGARRAPRLFG